ncbi:unnamed protein product [Rotaria sp. Silwood1]|nr:unnamed protein product [Rotaria sp. Silwood1]CAF1345287.1 unnamed protein product [Rotaria sp. Silwood1]CAF3458936.1 unnamed protein product [Rotaria sp. Silwood1]CAF3500956.1 unnamed protein product [Rotaria sp. Silwood1]CAF4874239.1 unnamed protein product [Rotaria sp. Silwood1]
MARLILFTCIVLLAIIYVNPTFAGFDRVRSNLGTTLNGARSCIRTTTKEIRRQTGSFHDNMETRHISNLSQSICTDLLDIVSESEQNVRTDLQDAFNSISYAVNAIEHAVINAIPLLNHIVIALSQNLQRCTNLVTQVGRLVIDLVGNITNNLQDTLQYILNQLIILGDTLLRRLGKVIQRQIFNTNNACQRISNSIIILLPTLNNAQTIRIAPVLSSLCNLQNLISILIANTLGPLFALMEQLRFGLQSLLGSAISSMTCTLTELGVCRPCNNGNGLGNGNGHGNGNGRGNGNGNGHGNGNGNDHGNGNGNGRG